MTLYEPPRSGTENTLPEEQFAFESIRDIVPMVLVVVAAILDELLLV